jgi:acyl-coenzyme A thioesterase PaaI-like protein
LVFVVHELVLLYVEVHSMVVGDGLIRSKAEVVQVRVELVTTDGDVVTDRGRLGCGARGGCMLAKVVHEE